MQIAKRSLLICSCILITFILPAQVKLPSLNSNSIKPDVIKVVEDYPNQFKNITAEQISANPQTTEFRSTIKINGGEQTVVTKYTAKKKEIYSWHVVMASTEEFDDAVKKYKTFYNQLNDMTVRLGAASYTFKAKYEAPEEEKSFNSTIFTATSDNELAKRIRVELLMENELMEWKVKILVYGLEREDTDPAPEKEK